MKIYPKKCKWLLLTSALSLCVATSLWASSDEEEDIPQVWEEEAYLRMHGYPSDFNKDQDFADFKEYLEEEKKTADYYGHGNLTSGELEENLKNLEGLTGYNFYKCIGLDDGMFAHLNPETTTLSLAYCTQLDLLNLTRFTNLTLLNLRGCSQLDDETFQELTLLTKLKDLNLSECPKLRHEGYQDLRSLPNLERLNISHNKAVNDDVMRRYIRYLTGLVRLNVSHSENLTDAGFFMLEEDLVKLEELDVSFCKKLSNTLLRRSLSHFKALRFLNLGGSGQIDHEGIIHLKSLPSLQLLNISDCPRMDLTDEIRQEFRESLDLFELGDDDPLAALRVWSNMKSENQEEAKERVKKIEREVLEKAFKKGEQKYLKNSYKEAIYWLQKAANNGHMLAQYRLGTLYDIAEGVIEKNPSKAMHFYQLAAIKGHKESQENLTFLYFMKYGVREGVKYLREKFKEQKEFLVKIRNMENSFINRIKTYDGESEELKSDEFEKIVTSSISGEAWRVLSNLRELQADFDHPELTKLWAQPEVRKFAQTSEFLEFFTKPEIIKLFQSDLFKKAYMLMKNQSIKDRVEETKLLLNPSVFKTIMSDIGLFQFFSQVDYSQVFSGEFNEDFLNRLGNLSIHTRPSISELDPVVRSYQEMSYGELSNELWLYTLNYIYELRDFLSFMQVSKRFKFITQYFIENMIDASPIEESNLDQSYRFAWKTLLFNNRRESIALLKQLVEQGYVSAMVFLGNCYRQELMDFNKNFKKAKYFYDIAGKSGHSGAQNKLGLCYEKGLGVEKDLKEAARLYQLAAKQRDADAQYNLGRCYQQGNGVLMDSEKALVFYQLAAKQEHAGAQNKLGDCYHKGLGVGKNLKEAARLYQLAAKQRDADAQYKLGLCYQQGDGVLMDSKRAVGLYQLAARQGHVDAQNRLGLCYEKGLGVEKDLKEAARLYQLAAKQGNIYAQVNLSRCYLEGIGVQQDLEKGISLLQKATEGEVDVAHYNLALLYEHGQGVEKNLEKAALLYQLAAEQGNVNAQFNLGTLYHKGQGVEKDLKKAISWYQQAAESGCGRAQFNLGYFYSSGQGVKQDQKKALFWYQKAAEQGLMRAQMALVSSPQVLANPKKFEKNIQEEINLLFLKAEKGDSEAQFNLGYFYSVGYGVNRDINEGIYYMLLAAEQGHTLAQAFLGACYYNGQGVERNYEEAVNWFKKAAAAENPIALNYLALCYEQGQGVEKNEKKALASLKQAAELGNTDAQNKLGYMYFMGLGFQKSHKKAVKWFRKAASQGDSTAQANLGESYELGIIENKINFKKAIEWYAKSSNQGNDYGKLSLAHAYEYGRGVEKSLKKARDLKKGISLESQKRWEEDRKSVDLPYKSQIPCTFSQKELDLRKETSDLLTSIDRMAEKRENVVLNANDPHDAIFFKAFDLLDSEEKRENESTNYISDNILNDALEKRENESTNYISDNILNDALQRVQPLSGLLGSTRLHFIEHQISGYEGNCGFHCLGGDRDRAVEQLLRHKNDPVMRSLLLPEIKSLFFEDKLPQRMQMAGANLYQRYHAFVTKVDNLVRSLNNEYFPEGDKDRKKAEDLAGYLQEKGDKQNATALSTLLSERDDIMGSQFNRLYGTERAYESFVKDFIAKGNWMGYVVDGTGTLDALARLNKMNVYVWRKGDNGNLNLVHQSIQPGAKDTKHLLHTHNLNHFNLLEIVEESNTDPGTDQDHFKDDEEEREEEADDEVSVSDDMLTQAIALSLGGSTNSEGQTASKRDQL